MLPRARALALSLAAAGALLAGVAGAANPRVEADARELQKEAIEHDFLTVDYDGAIAKLQKAIAKCGANKCSDELRSTLLRDLGAMQISGGDEDSGNASFAAALKIDPSLDLDPRYRNAQLDRLWKAAKKKAAAAGGGGSGAGAGGGAGAGLTAPPPADGLVRTQYPIYAEYAGAEPAAKCFFAYKNALMSDWSTPAELEKHGKGFGGYVPCTDVAEGRLDFYVQCFNATNKPVGALGKRDKPLSAAIKPVLPSGAPPALPGDEPPKQCPGSDSGCPPDSPACQSTPPEGDGTTTGPATPPPSGKANGEACEADDECTSGNCASKACAPPGPEYPHFWAGVWGDVDAVILGGVNNACQLDANAGSTSGYYCVDSSNNDFPVDATTNMGIKSDSTNGGLRFPTNIRVGASLDYAATTNILVGARIGYVLNTYPGQAAPMQNGAERANKFAPFHLEARFTYVIGKDAVIKPGVSPFAFVGAGISQFDAGQPVLVSFSNFMSPQNVNAWVIGGPFFFAVGGGGRLLVAGHFAATFGAKFFGAIGGGASFMPGFAPELGATYGF